MKEKKREERPPGAPEWLVTFSDLVSLLVTLFIMMLTFSTQEVHDLHKIVNLIKGGFGIIGDEIRNVPQIRENLHKRNLSKNGVTRFDPLEDGDTPNKINELEGFVVEEDKLHDGIRIVPDTVSSFAPGDDRPSAQLEAEIRRLAHSLRRSRQLRYRIEGHVDTQSDRNTSLGDMDVLALARARRVARIMGLEGLPLESVVLSSRGSRMPRGDPWTESGQAKNRRIEIVVSGARKRPGRK
ncbi:MAG: flagellar motor protein MotB [Planctomycetota bacterium]